MIAKLTTKQIFIFFHPLLFCCLIIYDLMWWKGKDIVCSVTINVTNSLFWISPFSLRKVHISRKSIKRWIYRQSHKMLWTADGAKNSCLYSRTKKRRKNNANDLSRFFAKRPSWWLLFLISLLIVIGATIRERW